VSPSTYSKLIVSESHNGNSGKKGKSRITATYIVLRMRRLVWHMHDVFAIQELCTVTQSCSWLGLSVTVRVRAGDGEWIFSFPPPPTLFLKVTNTFILPSWPRLGPGVYFIWTHFRLSLRMTTHLRMRRTTPPVYLDL